MTGQATTIQVLTGDCVDVLRTLPAGHFHAVVTSPPYFGLRDYGVSGQIGLEKSLPEFIDAIVRVLREVRRVLRPDGTVWLNLGDSYAANGVSGQNATWAERSALRYAGGGGKADAATSRARKAVPTGLKAKDLMMVPARVALALQDDGWWLRKEIIWAKPNPMPESASDRPTSSHEKVYLLAASERYFYDAEAVREGRTSDEDANTFRGGSYLHDVSGKRTVTGNRRVRGVPPRHAAYPSSDQSGLDDVGRGSGRNLRDVWTIATAPFPEAHFATFPPRLAELCIQAGTSAGGCCPNCGTPWRRQVEVGEPDLDWQRACGGDAAGGYTGASTKDHAAAGVQDASAVKARILAGMRHRRTTGWAPSCRCAVHDPVPCRVLDPFGGAGTTGLVADQLQRNATLIELNPEYVAMARRRIVASAPLFTTVAAE